jgi:hypothetical protein
MPAIKRSGHRRGRWPAAALAVLAIALTGLVGCDGDDDADSKTTATQPSPARGSADPAVVKRIPLKSTPDQVVAQIGRPARIERSRAPSKTKGKTVALTCYLYRVTGGRPRDRIRLCFAEGKLISVLTARAKR